MPAYVFFEAVSIHPERMAEYRDKAFATVKAFGGKLVAGTDNIDRREGDWCPKRVMARAWYDSPEYQELLPIRLDANRDKMIMFAGLP